MNYVFFCHYSVSRTKEKKLSQLLCVFTTPKQYSVSFVNATTDNRDCLFFISFDIFLTTAKFIHLDLISLQTTARHSPIYSIFFMTLQIMINKQQYNTKLVCLGQSVSQYSAEYKGISIGNLAWVTWYPFSTRQSTCQYIALSTKGYLR